MLFRSYHIDFPKFYLPTVMLDTLSKNLPIIFISSLFSNNLVGLYSFALRILSLPLLLIGTSVGQVFYQKFSENTHNIQSRKALLTKTWRHLALIGLVPMIICFMYSAPIFAFVFGEEWRLAGEIAAILSPYLYAQFVFSPTSTVFIALKQQNINLIFGFFVMTYRILVLWFGHHINNFMAALQILVIVEIIEIFIYDYILWKKL